MRNEELDFTCYSVSRDGKNGNTLYACVSTVLCRNKLALVDCSGIDARQFGLINSLHAVSIATE
jgi:hypothetical protein